MQKKKRFDSQIYIFLTDLLGDYLMCLTKLIYGVLQGLHECKPNPIKKQNKSANVTLNPVNSQDMSKLRNATQCMLRECGNLTS